MFHGEAVEPVPGSLAGREPDPFPFSISRLGQAPRLSFVAGALAAVGDGASLAALSFSYCSFPGVSSLEESLLMLRAKADVVTS